MIFLLTYLCKSLDVVTIFDFRERSEVSHSDQEPHCLSYRLGGKAAPEILNLRTTTPILIPKLFDP